MMEKICMYVWNDFEKDDRVKKKAESLAKKYIVEVHSVCKHKKFRPEVQYSENIKVYYYWFNSTFAWLWNRTIGNKNFWKDKAGYCDLVDCNDPDTLWAGYFSKKANSKIRVIYDSHEYWKGTRRKEYFFAYTLYSYICNTWHYWTEQYLVKKVADKFICVSPEIRDLLIKDYSLDFKVIANMASYNDSKAKEYSNIIRGASAGFIGSYVRPGADLIGEVFYDNEIHPIAIGGKVKSRKWTNIGFLNKVEFRKRLLMNKYGILGYEVNCDNIKYSLPNKLFEYIQAECPVITVKGMESVIKIVEKYQIGVVAESLAYKDIDTAIKKLIKNRDEYKQNMQQIKKKLCWEAQENKLLHIYDWRNLI